MKSYLLAIASLIFCLNSTAAIPSGPPRGVVKNHDMDRTVKALHMTHDPGMADLMKQGHWAYRNLITLAFDEKRPIQLRWRALTRMAKIGQKNSVPELERAAKSEDWFMRAAALVAFRRIDRDQAVAWARKLIVDPALVVRAEAVTTIGKMLDKDSKSLLWKQLNDPQNFRHGKGLWLRRKIVEAYATLSEMQDIRRLVSLLDEEDQSLHGPAIEGLERVTRNPLGGVKEPVELKAKYWKSWYAKNKEALSL